MSDKTRWPDSKLANGVPFYDWTTLQPELLEEAASLTIRDLHGLSNDRFQVMIYDTREAFFLAEAMEYINAWRKATADSPCGICGPIGPTEQLPLVAHLVNELEIDLSNAHFWGMDEWIIEGKEVSMTHPLSFARADLDLCFHRIKPELRMPMKNLHFPAADPTDYIASYDMATCVTMQGGQGQTKHWAFNEPPMRVEPYLEQPPSVDEYLALSTRVVDLHPDTISQNARTSGGGKLQNVPSQAVSVGPTETWKARSMSIWHPGWHDNPLGIRLTALMISRGIATSVVPMSLLALHPGEVKFNYLREGIGDCDSEMH